MILVVTCDVIVQVLGWAPRVPLEKGLTVTIDYFRNPREPVATTPWNITVYNSSDDIQYSWNETSPTRPTTLIYGTAEPGYMEINRDSE